MLCGGLILWTGAAPAAPPATEAAPKAPVDAELKGLLDRMGQTQSSIKTLEGDFVQEKSLELLAEPEVSRGHLYYEAPSRILWEYRSPDQTLLLIDEKNLVAYYPDLKLADRVNIEGKRDRYEKYFGMALGKEGPMQEYFEIELAKESDIPGTALLVLTPKNKRIEKYVSEMRLWVDRKTMLPRKLEYREENGDSTAYQLENVVTNKPIPAGKLSLDLPADVKVTELQEGFKSRRKQSPL